MARVREGENEDKEFCFVEKENDFDFIFIEKEDIKQSSSSSDSSDYYTQELSAALKCQGSDEFFYEDEFSAAFEDMRLREEFLRGRLIKLCSTVKCLELHVAKWSHKKKPKCSNCSESFNGCLNDMRDLVAKLKSDLAFTVQPDATRRRKTAKKVPTDPSSCDIAVQTDLESAQDGSNKSRKGRIKDSNSPAETGGSKSVSEKEKLSQKESSNDCSGTESSSYEDSSDEDDSDNEESSCEESSEEDSTDETDNDTVASDSDQSGLDKKQKHPKKIPGDSKRKNTKDCSSPRDKRSPKLGKRKENCSTAKKTSSRKRGYGSMRVKFEYFKRAYSRSDSHVMKQFFRLQDSSNFMTTCGATERGKDSEESERIIQDMIMNFIDRHSKMDLGCFTDPEEYETDPDAPPTDSEDESNQDSSEDDEEKSQNEDSNDEVNELQEARLQLDENNKYLEQEIQLMQNQDLRLSTRLDYDQHYKFYEDLRNELIAKKFDVKYSRETTEAHDERIWKSSYQYEDVAEWLFLANNLLNPASPHCLDAKLKESEAQVLKSEIWLGRLREKLAMAEYRLKVLDEECKTRNYEILRRIAQIDRQIRRVGRSMWQVFDVICHPRERDTKQLSKFEMKRMIKVEKKRSHYLNKLLIWLEQEKDRLLDMRRNFRNKLRESDSIAVFIEQEKRQLEVQKKDLARRGANFTESRRDMEDIRADFDGYVSEYEDIETETSESD